MFGYLAIGELVGMLVLGLMLYRWRGRAATAELNAATLGFKLAESLSEHRASVNREDEWREHVKRLESVIATRDDKIRRQAAMLDRLDDPASAGARILDELRAPLPTLLSTPAKPTR